MPFILHDFTIVFQIILPSSTLYLFESTEQFKAPASDKVIE